MPWNPMGLLRRIDSGAEGMSRSEAAVAKGLRPLASDMVEELDKPIEVGGRIYTGRELAKMDHATLYRLRDEARDQATQDTLAGFEHRAFAREVTGDNPLMVAPLMAAAPAYQAVKLLPKSLTGNESRSAPSAKQWFEAILGLGEGLRGVKSEPSEGTPVSP